MNPLGTIGDSLLEGPACSPISSSEYESAKNQTKETNEDEKVLRENKWSKTTSLARSARALSMTKVMSFGPGSHLEPEENQGEEV